MKPIQEQEWRQNGDAARVVTASGVLVALVIGDRKERAALIAAIAAAPDMARALMATGRIESPGVWHMDECWSAIRRNEGQPCLGRCSDARDALRKAKVLP